MRIWLVAVFFLFVGIPTTPAQEVDQIPLGDNIMLLLVELGYEPVSHAEWEDAHGFTMRRLIPELDEMWVNGENAWPFFYEESGGWYFERGLQVENAICILKMRSLRVAQNHDFNCSALAPQPAQQAGGPPAVVSLDAGGVSVRLSGLCVTANHSKQDERQYCGADAYLHLGDPDIDLVAFWFEITGYGGDVRALRDCNLEAGDGLENLNGQVSTNGTSLFWGLVAFATGPNLSASLNCDGSEDGF